MRRMSFFLWFKFYRYHHHLRDGAYAVLWPYKTDAGCDVNMCISLFLVAVSNFKHHLGGDVARKCLTMMGVSVQGDIGAGISLFTQIIGRMIQYDYRFGHVYPFCGQQLCGGLPVKDDLVFASHHIKSAVNEHGGVAQHGDPRIVQELNLLLRIVPVFVIAGAGENPQGSLQSR